MNKELAMIDMEMYDDDDKTVPPTTLNIVLNKVEKFTDVTQFLMGFYLLQGKRFNEDKFTPPDVDEDVDEDVDPDKYFFKLDDKHSFRLNDEDSYLYKECQFPMRLKYLVSEIN